MVTYGALFARACASTAWNWVNFAAHHMMLGMFPPQAQDEIWGKSRDALIASSFVFPAGKARKVQDGYLLSGRWPFSSGVDPSEWNMLAGLARLDDNLPPEQRIFLRAALAVQGDRHLVRRRPARHRQQRRGGERSCSCPST